MTVMNIYTSNINDIEEQFEDPSLKDYIKKLSPNLVLCLD
jgi:hypothetical protein